MSRFALRPLLRAAPLLLALACDRAETTAPVEPVEPPKPAAVLEPGAKGEQVRDLQHRLFQMAWLPETTTGRYDATTKEAVAGFQGKRGFKATGVVDRKTWTKLVIATPPTWRHDSLGLSSTVRAARSCSDRLARFSCDIACNFRTQGPIRLRASNAMPKHPAITPRITMNAPKLLSMPMATTPATTTRTAS